MGKTIKGSSTIGVTLSVNPTTIAGTIATSYDAVFGSAAKAWKLVNDGTIESAREIGVYLLGVGQVTNAKHGTIGGYEAGIFIKGDASISNAGTIAGNVTGIEVAEDGASAHITNSAGGVITGGTAIEAGGNPYYKVFGGKGSATILNQGLISGQTGIYALSGTIDNAKGGTIASHYGIAVALGGAGTIINAGLIETTSHYGYAIRMGSSAGNELLLQKGATLIGAIAEFTGGQTIDEAGLTITTESFANGVLTLFDGKSEVGTLGLFGNLNTSAFTLTSDGHGGTDIGLGTENFAGTYINGIVLSALNNVVAARAHIAANYEAAISGSAYRDWTLTNQGTIIGGHAGASFAGVLLAGGGFVSNAAHGLIEGDIGIEIASGTIVDAGTIIGTAGPAIYLSPGSLGVDIVLQQSARLEGAIYGFLAGDTIDFAGITATGESFGGGFLTLTNGHKVEATIALDGLFKNASFKLKTISGGTEIIAAPTETFTGHYGVELRLSSSFTSITATGSFGGAVEGVVGKGGTGLTLLNSGTVTGGSDGVTFVGGQVTNAAGGFISGDTGANMSGGLINAGSIRGSEAGIQLYGPGFVSRNLAGGSIYGGYLGAGLRGGTFANAGTVSGGEFGISLTDATLSNTGLVTGRGGNYDVYGLMGMYEYRAGGFASNAVGGIIDDATGARVAGGVLVNAGNIIGDNNFGGIENSRGLVVSGGTVTNAATGTISGAYGAELERGTLTDAGIIASTIGGTAIAFGSFAATLVLDKGNAIDGAISGFIAGDVIDFAGTSITSKIFSGGILTLTNGGAIVETLSFTGSLATGDFTLVPEGTAGTELILNSSMTSASIMQFVRPEPAGAGSSLTIPAFSHPIPAAAPAPGAALLPTITGWIVINPTTPPALVPAVTLGQ
jgi:hypothetical protein